RADMSITKAGSTAVVAGTDVTYTLTAANLGPSDAQAVSVSDTIPAGTTFRSVTPPSGWNCTAPAVGATGQVTCSRASLTAGASGQVSLTVRLGASATDGSQLCNAAS